MEFDRFDADLVVFEDRVVDQFGRGLILVKDDTIDAGLLVWLMDLLDNDLLEAQRAFRHALNWSRAMLIVWLILSAKHN